MAVGLLTGGFFSKHIASLRDRITALNGRIENFGNLRDAGILLLTLSALLTQSEAQNARCNSNTILSSEVTTCEMVGDTQTCKVTTQAKLTLKNLQYGACLTLKDKHGEHLLSLEVFYHSLPCDWSTVTQYYTYPVRVFQEAGLACPQNKYCGWGDHCNRNSKFESLTEESLSWPGITDCVAGDSGSICWILDSQSCLFYRWYLKPDLREAYEVRSIQGYTCYPIIQVKLTGRDQIWLRTSSTAIYLYNHTVGVHVEGAYHQPTPLLSKSLVMRHFMPYTAFLEDVASPGRPKYGEIGDVQTSNMWNTEFIFDEKIVSCSFYEEQLRCAHTPSYLMALIHKKTGELPRTFHTQKLYVNDNRELKSYMLTSTPLVVHIELDGYTFTVQQQKVCPKIVRLDPIVGCHNCETPSVLPIIAFSTCSAGIADVELEEVILLTPVLNLTDKEQSFEIKFKAMRRCITGTFCLRYKISSSCEPIKFCLADPDIALVQPNVTITTSVGQMQAGDSFWSSITSPFDFLSSFSLSYILYVLCGIIAIIFLISCCLNMSMKLRTS